MSSGPPANVNVTAILEKANAIRKVHFSHPPTTTEKRNNIYALVTFALKTAHLVICRLFRLLEVMMETMMIIGVTIRYSLGLLC